VSNDADDRGYAMRINARLTDELTRELMALERTTGHSRS